MLKVLKVIKGISIFLIVQIIGAIVLFYVEPIFFQESHLESIVQVLIILALFFVFFGGMVHIYLRNSTRLKE
ncbi:MAG: hypothetical protein KAJ22_01885 [Candidatus Izimaplasma sp.]|nr:hypothetical protein [Candidatus Izimaplasma bacterium]